MKRVYPKGQSILNCPQDYVVLDLETTGFSAEQDSIIEIGAIRVINGKPTDTFSSLVKPECKVKTVVENLTGITSGMLENEESITTVLPRFLKWVGDDHIVGHNVNFDLNFLTVASMRIMHKPFINNFTDTLRLANSIADLRLGKNSPVESHKLESLTRYFGIKNSNAHRGLSDCYATQKLLEKLMVLWKDPTHRYLSSLQKGSDMLSHNSPFFQCPSVNLDNELNGKRICVTGTLSLSTRDRVMELITKIGGIPQNSVSSKTDILVVGENAGSKVERAKALGVSMLSEQEFNKILNTIFS